MGLMDYFDTKIDNWDDKQQEKVKKRPVQVTVTDINVSFLNLTALLIKVSLAALPAAIIVGVMYLAVLGIFQGVFSR